MYLLGRGVDRVGKTKEKTLPCDACGGVPYWVWDASTNERLCYYCFQDRLDSDDRQG